VAPEAVLYWRAGMLKEFLEKCACFDWQVGGHFKVVQVEADLEKYKIHLD